MQGRRGILRANELLAALQDILPRFVTLIESQTEAGNLAEEFLRQLGLCVPVQASAGQNQRFRVSVERLAQF